MKNWKTTASGIAAILPQILTHLFPKVITIEVANSLTALFVAIGLIAAKDSNVTGGTTKQ